MNRLAQLIKMYESDPSDEFLQYALAQEYAQQHQEEKAIQLYANLIERSPKYIATYYHYGSLLIGLNRKVEAKTVIEKGIDIAQQLRAFKDKGELEYLLMEIEE